jgi:hypothetical protein
MLLKRVQKTDYKRVERRANQRKGKKRNPQRDGRGRKREITGPEARHS